MPAVTYPNQRLVNIHRERVSADFLGIQNENWMAAARDLGAHATLLYLYLASNANNYQVALSPAAIRQAIGMARSTFHDQFHRLEDKGYLIPAHGNTYDFYEVPRARDGKGGKNGVSADGHSFEDYPADGKPVCFADDDILQENIEINNTLSEDDLTNIRKMEEQRERERAAEGYYVQASADCPPLKVAEFHF